MMNIKGIGCLLITLLVFSCTQKKEVVVLDQVSEQLGLLLDDAITADKNPRTLDENGDMHWATREGDTPAEEFDWTLGFFPGSCWYIYELTKDETWKVGAEKIQSKHEKFKDVKFSHDLGFIFQCSYGNAYRLTGNEAYKQVLIDAGDALISRFNPTVGCIQSWDVTGGWQAERGWQFPVIIDNMMNLEMLFDLSLMTGNAKYKDVAIAHANTTLKNHFREDFSSYHVVDYATETGEVRSKQTAQGYAKESSWARGQAWAVYGYTVCYRYTKDEKYLKQAIGIADYICNYEAMPEDGIPYWDYNAPNIPNEPRDVSAATVTASALYELNLYTQNKYQKDVDQIMESLSTDAYTAKIGTNKHFILKHSVGSIPHGREIDVPLNYADYYYIEALLRKNGNMNHITAIK